MKTDCGWIGKILWVDLSSQTHVSEEIGDLLTRYLGGRGLAARMAWDHLSPGLDGLEEENLLMFVTGPLAGTPAPSAGRGYVFGVAPQAFPSRYTRSGFGGRWSSMLKFAGYDGLMVKGKAEGPSILVIQDDRVEVKGGRQYWGLDAIETQKALQAEFGKDAAFMVIGQAGENQSRIATIQSGANSAAGQGGFGAVMGSKNLKAIVIKGTGGVKIAHLDRLLDLRRDCVRLLAAQQAKPPQVESVTTYTTVEWPSDELMADGELGEATMAYIPCTGCPLLCRAGGVATQRFFKNVPGVLHPARLKGALKCVELGVMGWGSITDREREHLMQKMGREYRYNPGFRAGFETANLCDRYGINAWEFESIMAWLTECKMAGIDLEPILEMPFDENGPVFWQTLLKKMAFREGIGDILAQGIARAEEKLGQDIQTYSPHAAHGFAHHGLGTYNWAFFPFPYWIPVTLMWSSDTRDPMSDTGHKYCMDMALNPEEEKAELLAEKFYGVKDTLMPRPAQVPEGEIPSEMLDVAYSNKEKVTIRHQNRAMVNGCLILCDGPFPMVYSPVTEDGSGDTAMESKLLGAVTGLDIDEKGLDEIGESLFNLERAVSIREGRTVEDDLSIVPKLTSSGDWSRGITLDGERYKRLLKQYYVERGWNPETGVPDRDKLGALGLSDVSEVLNK